VLDSLGRGDFSFGDSELFRPIVDSLLYDDQYLLLADYADYIRVQDEVAQAYRHPSHWTRMSILNTARCGFFSSDRAIQQYCADIWGVKPLTL
jgi:glycogen phosphorylase